MMERSDISPREFQRFIEGINYPCHRDELYDHADSNGAPEEILQVIDELPDRDFETSADVMSEYSSAEANASRRSA